MGVSTQGESISGFRLSPQQERIWHLQEINCDAYQASVWVEIEGDLDKKIFFSALGEVVQAYEILRTSFYRTAGMRLPIQVILEKVELAIQEHNLLGRSPSEQETEANCIWQRLEAECPRKSEDCRTQFALVQF